jgi:hypothetical protein
MRDTLIPFGDFHKLYARYEELSGRPVDIEAVKLHYFAATLSNQLMFGNAVLDPPLDTDLMNNMQWNSETNIMATEALAEFMDIELPTVETPEPISKRTDSTYEHVIAKLRNISGTDEFVQHELRLMFRAARHLFRSSQIGDELERENILDLKELLGYAPDNWAEADAALERFVIADKNTGEYDAQLVPLFHRRNLRNHMSLGPLGSSMTKHYTPQPF